MMCDDTLFKKKIPPAAETKVSLLGEILGYDVVVEGGL